MSTAHAEAIGMAVVAAFFLAIGIVALRVQRRTGQPNQWRYVGPAVAGLAIVLLILNLNGVVFSGV